MKYWLAIACIFLAIMSKAQSTQFTLKGTVIEAGSNNPLSKASVLLKSTTDSKLILNAITDSTGSYRIRTEQAGTYLLSVSFTGYKSFEKTIVFKPETPQQTLNISLQTQSDALQAVTVTGSKSLIENKPDRLVYNVEKDITSQTGDATDVLRKVPQVTVDATGNVELLGSPSIRFLINGKPSTIFGASITDALQSIPASQIESIEVISSPGAKYDAAGTGGIINIILKKNKTQGISGIVNLTAGTRQSNGSVNISYKKNNVSVSAYFNGSEQVTVKSLQELNRTALDTATKNNYYFNQSGYNNFSRNSYRTGMSMDWDINSKNSLSFSVGYNHFGNTNQGQYNLENHQVAASGADVYDIFNTRNSSNSINNATTDASLDYRKKFKKNKEELSFIATYSSGNNLLNYYQEQTPVNAGTILSGASSKNPGKDHLTTLSLNYTLPITKNFTFETGAKTDFQSLISNADVLTYSTTSNSFVHDNNQSYTSTFNRSIYAGYVSASTTVFKTFNITAGARFEHTVNKADYSNAANTVIPSYNNFAPSFTVSHKITEDQTIRFSYAYRLERPEYRDLNPFMNLADPHNITTGNPNMVPEIGRDFQLGYNFNFGKENNLNIIFLYTYNSPDIKTYTTFYPSYKIGDSVYTNVNLIKRDNIASEVRWGTNISGAFVVGALTVRPGVQLYNRIMHNIYAIPQTMEGFEYRLNLNANYQFSKTLIAEAFGNYRSGIKWQGSQASFYTYSLALKKQVLKNKGSLGLVVVNPFDKNLVQQTTTVAVGLNNINRVITPIRSVGISFMYKFGKLKITKVKEAENLLNKPVVDQ